jgi:hypothetical protein
MGRSTSSHYRLFLLTVLCAVSWLLPPGALVSGQPTPVLTAIIGCMDRGVKTYNCTSGALINVIGSGFAYNTTEDGAYLPTLVLISGGASAEQLNRRIYVVNDTLIQATLPMVAPLSCGSSVDVQLWLQNRQGTIAAISNSINNGLSYALHQPPAVYMVGCKPGVSIQCSPWSELVVQGYYLDSATLVELSVPAIGCSRPWNVTCNNPVNTPTFMANVSVISCQIPSPASSVNNSEYWNQPINLLITNQYQLNTSFNGTEWLQWTPHNDAAPRLSAGMTGWSALAVLLTLTFALAF